MSLTLKVHPQLDERAKRRAAEDAERTFADAGARSGQQFSGMFSRELSSKLDERALDASVSRLEGRFARAGTTSAEKFNAALIAESARTGIAADKIGAELTKHMGAHGLTAGDAFITGLTSKMSMVAPQAANVLSGISSVATKMGGDVSIAGLAAAGGVAAIGAAAIETTKHLYDIGETFDNVSKSVEIRTGKMGSDLEALTGSIDNVARRTASSIEQIGDVGGRLSQSLGLSGQPLEELTKKVADLDRMTGENLNIRDFGKAMKAFGESNPGAALDDLYRASTRTGAPVNELVESLRNMGASARSLHLDLGQTSALIDAFDQAGLNADTSIRGLNKAISEASTKGLDLKTVLFDAITQIHHFLDTGDEQKAQELGQKLFGVKGAQQFIDAIRQGKLTVDDLKKSLSDAGPTIDKMNDDTMRWADTWTIVKNRIEDALKPLSKPVFDFIQHSLRDISQMLPGAQPGPGPTGPSGPAAPGAPTLPGMLLPGAGKPGQSALGPAGGGPGNFPGLPVPMPVPSGAAPAGSGGDQDVLGALDQKPAKGAGRHLPEAPEVPYGPGYGAPPRPGESGAQYSGEQRVLEERHAVEEARARVTQLEHDNNATADDIQKARNALLKAQQSEQQAELSLYEEQTKALNHHVDSMHELGAKIDDDFGISKGLSGIADNLTKFLGNLLMAGPLAAMNQIIERSGIRQAAPGAGGFMGMAAVSGMLGPQYVPSGGGGYGGAGGYGVGGYPGGGGYGAGVPGLGGPSGPGGFGAAAGNPTIPPPDENAIRTWAQAMFGIPNSMGTGSWENAAHSHDGGWHHRGLGGADVASGYGFDFHGTPEQMDAMANWIALNDPQNTLELIHQGPGFDPSREIKDTKPGDVYGPGVNAQHQDHVHWAVTAPPYNVVSGSGGAAPGPGGGPLQGPNAIPGPDMNTDASGAVVAPSGWAGGGGAHAANWNAIAGPEASGNWQADTGNGFFGGLQFAPGTWKEYGGDQFGPNAAQATPDQQMTVGDRVVATGWGGHPPQGPGAWPATSGAHPDWFGPGGGGGFRGGPMPTAGGPGQGPTDIGGASPAPGIGGGLPGGGSGITGTIGGAAESAIGGVAPAAGLGGGMTAVGGGAAAGAGAGAASLGIGMAIQIAMQEAQRAIQYAGAVGGIATEGLLQTFLPTGGSDLAQKSWLTRIAGGLAGARPQIPNAAGKSTTKSGGAGAQPLPPGGSTVNNQGGDTHSNVHNGDINITAPSGDAKDISQTLSEQQQTQNSGSGYNVGHR